MKYVFARLLLILLLFNSCKTEKKSNTLVKGDFEISTNKIAHNKAFSITYNGQHHIEESIFFQLVQSEPYAYDLNFIKNKAVITVPDSISAVSFHIKIDGKYDDNNKEGYLLPVYTKHGEIAKGAHAAMEYHKLGNGADFGLVGSDENSLKALELTITNYPELKDNWRSIHFQLTSRKNTDKVKELAESYISEINSKTNITEDDYENLASIYATLRNREAMDSISKMAMAKYPKGKAKQQALMNTFYDAKTLAEKEKIFNVIETNFGMTSALTYAATSIAATKFKSGDDAGFKLYDNKITSVMEKAGLYNSVAWPAAEEGKNMEVAAKLSKKSLDLLMDAKKDVANKPTYYTEKQYLKNIDRSYSMFADTYALLQYKLGNIKEAIAYQAKAIGNGKNTNVNDRYIEFLVADKQYKLASEKAKIFLNEGHGSAKMKADYKTAYSRLNPEAKDFKTIMAKIDKANYDKELAALKNTILDEVAPQFTLKNLKGKDIALSDLKGKIVILDFWATWCGPCKASFPVMKEVVEKYKDNNDVVLLFVDTFEDGKNRENNVAQFISDNHYDFHVLIDRQIKNSDDFEVAKKYNISGIPTKIIIGPSGKINFKSVGFSGDKNKLKQEMDLMIDLLKRNPVKP